MQHSYVQGLNLNSLIFSKEIVATGVGTDELVCNTTKINFVCSLAADVQHEQVVQAMLCHGASQERLDPTQ